MALPILKQSLWGLTLLAALGTGISAGVFFAFSNFVLKGLAAIPPSKGIAAMQSINVTAVNPLFMGILFGTAILSIAISITALGERGPATAYLLAGSLVYLLGVIVITAAGNVPLNNSLARLDPASADAAAVWTTFVTRWLAWNHVRTVSSLLASAAFILALTRLPVRN
jgi:uncharacterized membrane protein